jgi:hypothetical protein
MINLAIILDNKVEMIMQVDERLAAILTSQPIIVDVPKTEAGGPLIGWAYNPDTKAFTNPAAL